MGARLLHFWERWQAHKVSSWVVDCLRWGYQLQFWDRPPLTKRPMRPSDGGPKTAILQAEIETLLQKQAIEEVHSPNSPGFYSRLFVVPKPGGKWRPIIDLKALNHHLMIPKLRMESLQSIWTSLLPGHFTISVDLQDAYFQIPIHRSSRKYLRFLFKNRVYQFRALPFGLSSAPWLFTQVMGEVKILAHLRGISLFLYLDDWLAQMPTYFMGIDQGQFLVDLCDDLGLLLNLKKSELVPNQVFEFIGARFNLILARVFPKEENCSRCILKIQEFLSCHSPTAEMWQSILGHLVSQFRFIPFGRLYLRPLQWHLQEHWDQLQDSPEEIVPISPVTRTCLQWWISQLTSPVGVPLASPNPDLTIFTDASEKGWGAHVGFQTFQGTWSLEEQTLHINVLEMRAVRLALLSLNPPPLTTILVATDNSTVKSYINKQGGTRSSQMMQETALLFNAVIQNNWVLRARHIAGKLNVLADQLSRSGQVIQTEWSLHQSVADLIFQRWGRPLIDLCATHLNSKCPLFVSPVPDPRAWAVDALSVQFQGLEAYVYPPQALLPRILQKYQLVSHCRLLVVAPWWPKSQWFPSLMQLAVQPPMSLPVFRTLLKQSGSNKFHPNPQTLALHAWLLEK